LTGQTTNQNAGGSNASGRAGAGIAMAFAFLDDRGAIDNHVAEAHGQLSRLGKRGLVTYCVRILRKWRLLGIDYGDNAERCPRGRAPGSSSRFLTRLAAPRHWAAPPRCSRQAWRQPHVSLAADVAGGRRAASQK